MLVKNVLERGGPCKLRAFWEEKVHIVLSRKNPLNAVYEVSPESHAGRTRSLHRNLLLPWPCLPHELKVDFSSFLRKASNKNSHNSSAMEVTVRLDSFNAEDDAELLLFLQEQLERAEHQLMHPLHTDEMETTADSNIQPQLPTVE